MTRPRWALATLLVALLAVPARAQLPPALAPLRFLLGACEAVPGPGATDGTGRATFQAGLQDRVIVPSSYAVCPPRKGRLASRHDDLMVIRWSTRRAAPSASSP
ncbi:MAG: hypothetical protein ABSB58_09615 [Gemmatimonadales bacterium]|jgi:hypothetical protein